MKDSQTLVEFVADDLTRLQITRSDTGYMLRIDNEPGYNFRLRTPYKVYGNAYHDLCAIIGKLAIRGIGVERISQC